MSDSPDVTDATLKSLTLSAGELCKGFYAGRKIHAARVTSGTDAIRVTPIVNVAGATVTIDGGPVESGEKSLPISLQVGMNAIAIEVTAPDGETRNGYGLRILRPVATPAWTRAAESNPWAPRDSAGELVFRDRMWLFGGYTPELVNDVWSTCDGVNWTPEGAIPSESGVNIPVCFVHDDRMWITSQDGKLFSSPDGGSWSLVTDQAPWRGRYAAGSAVFGGRMWVMGGLGGGELFNDVWSSTDGVNWEREVAEAPWSKRQLFGMVAVHDEKIWLLGGGVTSYHPFKAYTDVWCSGDGRTWERVTDRAPWPARIWSNALVYRNRLWVLGGFRAEPTWQNFDDVWYSSDGENWNQFVTETVWSPRHEISPYVFDNKLWVIGGNSWPLTNDTWRLEIPGLTFLSQPVVEEFVTAEYSYRAHADFNESGRVHYRLGGSPDWLTLDAETGLIRGIPQAVGDFPVTVEAYDDAGETAAQDYTLHVLPVA